MVEAISGVNSHSNAAQQEQASRLDKPALESATAAGSTPQRASDTFGATGNQEAHPTTNSMEAAWKVGKGRI